MGSAALAAYFARVAVIDGFAAVEGRVVAAFMHAIPGFSGVILVMLVFLYTMAVLATNLFGEAFPQLVWVSWREPFFSFR